MWSGRGARSVTREDHYLSANSGADPHLAVPQLPADGQARGNRVMAEPQPFPTYIRLNLLPLAPPALAGALRGTWGRLSAPLFLLMRFSCLSARQQGVARLLADSSLSPFQKRPGVSSAWRARVNMPQCGFFGGGSKWTGAGFDDVVNSWDCYFFFFFLNDSYMFSRQLTLITQFINSTHLLAQIWLRIQVAILDIHIVKKSICWWSTVQFKLTMWKSASVSTSASKVWTVQTNCPIRTQLLWPLKWF